MGSNGTGPGIRDRIREACERSCETLQRKNRDYGNSALQRPRLLQKLSAAEGIMVRLSDKFARVENLLSGDEPQVKDESVLDTAEDIIGYSVLLRLAIEDWLAERKLSAQAQVDELRTAELAPAPPAQKDAAEMLT